MRDCKLGGKDTRIINDDLGWQESGLWRDADKEERAGGRFLGGCKLARQCYHRGEVIASVPIALFCL
jgi:hypothetical protein